MWVFFPPFPILGNLRRKLYNKAIHRVAIAILFLALITLYMKLHDMLCQCVEI